MNPDLKELQMIYSDVRNVVSSIEEDIKEFTNKSQYSAEYCKKAVEMKTQLLRAYEIKANILCNFNKYFL